MTVDGKMKSKIHLKLEEEDFNDLMEVLSYANECSLEIKGFCTIKKLSGGLYSQYLDLYDRFFGSYFEPMHHLIDGVEEKDHENESE